MANSQSRSMGITVLDPTFAVALSQSQKAFPDILTNYTWTKNNVNATTYCDQDSMLTVLTSIADLYRAGQLSGSSPTVILAQGITQFSNIPCSEY